MRLERSAVCASFMGKLHGREPVCGLVMAGLRMRHPQLVASSDVGQVYEFLHVALRQACARASKPPRPLRAAEPA
jgi:hypothetical protein